MMNFDEVLNEISKHEGLFDSILELQRSQVAGTITLEDYAKKVAILINGAGIDVDEQAVLDALTVPEEVSVDELDNVSGGGCGHDCSKWKDCGGSGRDCYPHC